MFCMKILSTSRLFDLFFFHVNHFQAFISVMWFNQPCLVVSCYDGESGWFLPDSGPLWASFFYNNLRLTPAGLVGEA